MCIETKYHPSHEHRYRLVLTVRGQKPFDLVVNAKSITEAISRADGYAHDHYPGQMVEFSIWHTGYSSDEVAREHGAILAPLEDFCRSKGLPVEVASNPCAGLVLLPPEHVS